MSYLKIALAAMKAAAIEGEVREQSHNFTSQSANHISAIEESSAIPIERRLSAF